MNDTYTTYESPDRELDWDDEVTNDGGYVLLPEGDYPFTITKMKRARWEGSSKVPPCRMALLTVAVHGGNKGDATCTNRLFLLSRFQWKIKELFVSIGLAKPEDEKVPMQWDKVQGSTGICRLAQREYVKQSGPHAGETGVSNEIQKFLPPPPPKAAPEKPQQMSMQPPAQPSWRRGAF